MGTGPGGRCFSWPGGHKGCTGHPGVPRSHTQIVPSVKKGLVAVLEHAQTPVLSGVLAGGEGAVLLGKPSFVAGSVSGFCGGSPLALREAVSCRQAEAPQARAAEFTVPEGL